MDAHDESRLQDLFDDRLPPAEAETLRRRLEADPALREAWDDLERIRRALAGGSLRAPADFLTGVRRRLAAARDDEPAAGGPPPGDPRPDALPDVGGTRPARWRRRPRVLAWAGALAAVLVAAFGLRLVLPGHSEPGVLTAREPSARPATGAEDTPAAYGETRSELRRSPAPSGGLVTPAPVTVVPRAPEPTAETHALAVPVPDARAPSTPLTPAVPAPAAPGSGGAGSPSPGPGAPVLRPRGPVDSVPPGLREPSDEVPAAPKAAPSEAAAPPTAPPAPPAAAGRSAGGTAAPVRSAAAVLQEVPGERLYAFAATSLDEGRAELALLVGDVEAEVARERAETHDGIAPAPATPAVPSGPSSVETLADELSGPPEVRPEVLGSVVLFLSPQAARELALRGLATVPDRPLAKETGRKPESGDAAKAAPRAAAERGSLRVRVLLVRPHGTQAVPAR